jgi:hypothetical protein
MVTRGPGDAASPKTSFAIFESSTRSGESVSDQAVDDGLLEVLLGDEQDALVIH